MPPPSDNSFTNGGSAFLRFLFGEPFGTIWIGLVLIGLFGFFLYLAFTARKGRQKKVGKKSSRIGSPGRKTSGRNGNRWYW